MDFILYGGELFTAIEVKNTKVTKPADFRGLKSFGEDYPEAKLILLYRGNVPMKHRNILIIPVDLFLKKPIDFLIN